MNFEYTKRSRNSALIEKDEIILWRRRFWKISDNIEKKDDIFTIWTRHGLPLEIVRVKHGLTSQ